MATPKKPKSIKVSGSKVEAARSTWKKSNPELLADFDALVAEKPGPQGVLSFLVEQGVSITYHAVWHWYQKQHPPVFDWNGDLETKAEHLSQEISKLMGGDVQPDVKKFQMLPALLREYRSVIAQLNDRKYIGDRRELEMNGIYFVLAELEAIFKDTAFETALIQAKKGVLAKYENR